MNNIMEMTIDPEFEKIIPPLTQEEFQQLEANILAEGEVFTPIFTWNGLIVDGHHRYRVIRQNPEVRYRVLERQFENRYAVISWICNNQLGRRNLSQIQKEILAGRRSKAEKMAHGASDGFRGNQHTGTLTVQNEPLPEAKSDHVTRQKIAAEMGMSESSVFRAEKLVEGLDAAEEVLPGIEREILSGTIKPAKKDIAAIAKAPPEERKELAENLRRPQEKQHRPKTRQETRELYRSIDEISARMAQPKEGNDVENVLGIIQGAADSFRNTCDFYLGEFPELLEQGRPRLMTAIDSLRLYIMRLCGGEPI